ncbi:UNVERIFIED_CONTAM: hypothetical protein HDU68_000578 [Siphonaria sp. JEL0065]|nr:hypothetical protein HDU68_000578 [Siphonaria sp. JEL0065]
MESTFTQATAEDEFLDRLLTDPEFWRQTVAQQDLLAPASPEFLVSPQSVDIWLLDLMNMPGTPFLAALPTPQFPQGQGRFDSLTLLHNQVMTSPLPSQSPEITLSNWIIAQSPSIQQPPVSRRIVPIPESGAARHPRFCVQVPKQVSLTAPQLPSGKFEQRGVIINAKSCKLARKSPYLRQ